MLREQIIEQMKVAMKARDADRLSVLRFMLSEIKNREIDAKHELGDEEVIEILRREVKRRTEAIEQFSQAGRTDIADKEQAELVVIGEFVPKLMTKEEVIEVVEKVLATLPEREFGTVMKAVMAEIKGRADGKIVSEVVRSKLQ